MSSPLEKPDGISWNPASVEMPPMPMIPPGEDAMSMTISGLLPTLTTPLATSVTALSAKETMFSGKVVEAQSAYQNADDSGGQSVGQLSSMIGQVGQMAQQAGGAAGGAGGGSSGFGSLMEQAMKAAQGGGSESGGPQQASAGQSAGQPSGAQGPAGAAGPQQRGDAAVSPGQEPGAQRDDGEAEHREAPAERPPVESAGPGDGQRGAGQAPVAPPEHPRRGDDDIARRM
jgi:hypothetical protein